jgi:pyruvate formate lyase activating enzyme
MDGGVGIRKSEVGSRNLYKPALFWEKHDLGVRCVLCPNYCVVAEGKCGVCRKRVNITGELVSLNYAQTISLAVDPLEKKPLYHYFPAEMVLSLGANSCNLTCSFCQNYSSSQIDCETQRVLPNELLEMCLNQSIRHVAFTYTEPFTWYEYVLESAELLYRNKISVILVTNGYVNIEPLKQLLPFVSAMNIDLKAYSKEFYNDVCGGRLQPVLEVIGYVHNKIHLEITLLLIEGMNDDLDELRRYFAFLKGLNLDIPLHISKYFPRYKMKVKETSDSLLLQVARIAKEYLNYVYIGNVGIERFQNTYCPKCGTFLIERRKFDTYIVELEEGRCGKCGKAIYGFRASY